MNTITFLEETKKSLIGKKIIDVGDNYIELDDGCRIYISEDEINFLN